MKKRMYETKVPKSKNIVGRIDPNTLKAPNPELLYARIKNRAATFEDRRFKKPKHKGKVFED